MAHEAKGDRYPHASTGGVSIDSMVIMVLCCTCHKQNRAMGQRNILMVRAISRAANGHVAEVLACVVKGHGYNVRSWDYASLIIYMSWHHTLTVQILMDHSAVELDIWVHDPKV
jgi:hypothetical protein